MDSSEMIFKFDGRQGAKIPDGIVPKNLTDQFTITMWMKHGPSPGVRAEKETILCNSDKTGESGAHPCRWLPLISQLVRHGRSHRGCRRKAGAGWGPGKIFLCLVFWLLIFWAWGRAGPGKGGRVEAQTQGKS